MITWWCKHRQCSSARLVATTNDWGRLDGLACLHMIQKLQEYPRSWRITWHCAALGWIHSHICCSPSHGRSSGPSHRPAPEEFYRQGGNASRSSQTARIRCSPDFQHPEEHGSWSAVPSCTESQSFCPCTWECPGSSPDPVLPVLPFAPTIAQQCLPFWSSMGKAF